MKFIPGDGARCLDRYEAGDSSVIGIANECGDITAYVRRADGTRGHSFGGPVYGPPEFANACQVVQNEAPVDWCDHRFDMTAAERRIADGMARKVGWL